MPNIVSFTYFHLTRVKLLHNFIRIYFPNNYFEAAYYAFSYAFLANKKSSQHDYKCHIVSTCHTPIYCDIAIC